MLLYIVFYKMTNTNYGVFLAIERKWIDWKGFKDFWGKTRKMKCQFFAKN